MGIFVKMKLTEKQRQRIRIIAGIFLIVGVLLIILLLIIYTNMGLEKLFTDDNIKCLDFCFNGENFSQQWKCVC